MPLNPSDTISGNGIPGQVTSNYTTGSSSWNIITQNLPGQVLTGTFPNTFNSASITPQNYNFSWPYRGGRSYPNRGTRTAIPAGIVGISSVGLVMHGVRSGTTVIGPTGVAFNINAIVAGVRGEDIYSGKPTVNGAYHYQDNRFITNDAWDVITTWTPGYTNSDGHSKIIGWSRDGYPIYGSFGYLDPLDKNSTVVKLASGYQLDLRPDRPVNRSLVLNGSYVSTTTFVVYSATGISPGMNLTGIGISSGTKITSLVGNSIVINNPITLGSGSIIAASYPPGIFVEDFSHSIGLPNGLDQHNGRYCVTPEFPEGTYAYFLTENSQGTPEYPYIIGNTYYGSLTAESTDSSLTSIITNRGLLTPTFSSAITNYNISVDNSVNNINFTVVKGNANSVAILNGATLFSGIPSQPVSLSVGISTSTIRVTSEYFTTSTYQITVNRLRKSINTLNSLSADEGDLSPSFSPTVNTYFITVGRLISSLTVNFIKTDSDSTVTVSDTTLAFGVNSITVTVTADNGDIRTYTINATRLSNNALVSNITIDNNTVVGFTPTTYLYFVNVSNNTSSIQLSVTAADSLSTILIEGQLLSSNNILLNPGVNPVLIKITSSDQSEDQFYRLDIFRQFSNVANLTNLALRRGNFILPYSPTFNSNVISYSATVPNSVTEISVSATLQEITGVLNVNGNPTLSDISTQITNLVVGVNTVLLNVVAPDLVTVKNYSINITREPSNISTLDSLFVYGAVLNPEFQTNVFNYSETVGFDVSSTKIITKSSHPSADIKINGVSVISGTPSQNISLVKGNNTATILVTAEDGISTSTYAVNVIRKGNYNSKLILLNVNVGTLTPLFDKEVYEYYIETSHNITQAEITAFADDVNADSIIISNDTTYITTTSGATSTVNLGGDIVNGLWQGTTTYSVNVIAEDQENESTYNLTFTRQPSTDSLLSAISISAGTLTPSFNSNILSYFISVPHATTTIGIIPTPRYILANSVYKGNILSRTTATNFPLYVGMNSFPIQVIAADGIRDSIYNITVSRASAGVSTVSLLNNLRVSQGTLSPAFDPEIFRYTLILPYEIDKIAINAVKTDTNSSISVDTPSMNDIPLISGIFSNNIDIPVNFSIIRVEVVAQDNASLSGYEIFVTRLGESESRLSDIYLSSGQLDKPFNKNITQYTVNVKNSINSVSVKPVVISNQSEIYVNNLFVPINSWSSPRSIDVGNNIVKIDVTAGDKSSKTIYEINFVRDSYVVTDPKELFLINQTDNISVTTVDNNLLRIFTKANKSYVVTSLNASLQNIEVIYPYRGGTNQSAIVKPLRPVNNIIGITVVGIPMFGPASNVTVQGANSSTWTLNVIKSKVLPTDNFGGYVTTSGLFNYRTNEFTFWNRWTDSVWWGDSFQHTNGHSKLIGFAADGYPIYGPYGYSNPVNSYSNITAMVSGYSVRDNGINRPQGITITYTGRELGNDIELSSSTFVNVQVGMKITSPALSTSIEFIVLAKSTIDNYITLSAPVNLSAFQTDLTASYPAGFFIEDYYYDRSKTSNLDVHNGRYCVTPEYPNGTYAYFATGVIEPEYPYIIGPTFYGSFSNSVPGVKVPPQWATNAGFITTATEGILFSRSLLAIGPDISYKLIGGDLPGGLSLNTSTGVVSGVPSLVWQTFESNFVLRAQNQYGIIDRVFRIDVRGATPPAIVSPGPRFAIGPSGENYIVNNQFVDFQFTAIADIVPTGKNIFFYIDDGDGVLPPGLTLTSSGRLYGQVLDELSLPYQAGSDGRYDAESYDSSPMEHESQQEFGVRGRFVNKTYRFFLSASNGPVSRKVEYIIDVRDPASLLDSGQYPIPPQWITPSNLGTIVSNSTFIYSLETYDCDPGSGAITYDWVNANGGNLSVLPPGLTLDILNGVISGTVAYTPVHNTVYSFNMRVIKNNITTGTTRFRNKTFTLTVLGTTQSGLNFQSNNLIGLLYQGETSELQVSAIPKSGNASVIYSLQSGNLPPGLTLASDGAVQGSVSYDSNQTSIISYNFNVRATDSAFTSIVGNFQIQVYPYEGVDFTKILLRPLLSLETRELYESFIGNQSIFDSTLMYRPLDPLFNVNRKIEFVLEHGIEQKYVADYAEKMTEYFSRKKLQFGSIKSAFAVENNSVLYEVVYVELIDNLFNSITNESVNAVIDIKGETVFPNSIDNMRNALEKDLAVNSFITPKFMKTVQDSSGVPLGRILCLPLCYCLPGNSKGIINKIANSGFDFKKIHFDVDRLIIENTLDNNTAKYVLFPKREA
jgi:hypothetical protein